MSRHPFEGEGFDRDRSIRFWNDIAYDYEGRIMQGDIPMQVAERLSERGIIGDDSDVVEFGCGPGTYSLPLSAYVRTLTCVDTSERMLSILKDTCASKNITTVLGDFMSIDLGRRFDTAMMTLCPGSGSKEAVLRAESVTEGWCVHLMWVSNAWDDIHAKVWKELGKDYSFEGRKSGLMESNLRELGREYDTEEFVTDIYWATPAKELIEREKRIFSVYGPYDAEGALMDTLGEFIDGNRFSFECTNTIKMICWRP